LILASIGDDFSEKFYPFVFGPVGREFALFGQALFDLRYFFGRIVLQAAVALEDEYPAEGKF